MNKLDTASAHFKISDKTIYGIHGDSLLQILSGKTFEIVLQIWVS